MNDKSLLEQKLTEIKRLADDCLVSLSNGGLRSKPAAAPTTTSAQTVNVSIDDITNKAKDCEESGPIERKILDSRSILDRSLMPLYICEVYFSRHKLTGIEISKVLSELGVVIRSDIIIQVLKLSKYIEKTHRN